MEIAARLGFIDGDLSFVKLVGDNLNISIDATGAILQGIGVQVDHISEKDKKPITFGGTVGATAGPHKTVAHPRWFQTVPIDDEVYGVMLMKGDELDLDFSHCDGVVNAADLRIVVNAIGASSVFNPRSDLNGDGKIDVSDLARVAADFGNVGQLSGSESSLRTV